MIVFDERLLMVCDEEAKDLIFFFLIFVENEVATKLERMNVVENATASGEEK